MKLRNKKILKLTESYFPDDVRVLKEAIAYKENGASVFVLAMNNGKQKSFEKHLGINVHRIPLSMKKGNWIGYIYEYTAFFILSLLYIYKLNRKNRFDLIHVHTIPDFLVFASFPAKISGAKVILDLAELMPEFYSFKFKVGMGNIVVKIARMFEYISMKYADKCITISKRIRDILEKRTGIKDITIIMNTIEPKTSFGSRESEKDRKFTLICHGHINAAYDLITCINATKLIKEDIPNFSFEVYGDGPYLDSCKQHSADLKLDKYVKFHGWVDREVVYNAISNATIGIIPARPNPYLNLSFSNKLGDFVALGKPVIAPMLESYLDYFPINSLAYIDSIVEANIHHKVIQLYNNKTMIKEITDNAKFNYRGINWNIMKNNLILLAASQICKTP